VEIAPARKAIHQELNSTLKVKLLAKIAPRPKPVERDMNIPLESFVCACRSHPDNESTIEGNQIIPQKITSDFRD